MTRAARPRSWCEGGLPFASLASSGAGGTQPTGQICSVANATGHAASHESNVQVSCEARTYGISGSLIGLDAGKTVVLQNGSETLSAGADGDFAFAVPVTHGGSYEVSVQAQPEGQTCTVSNPVGSNVTDHVNNVQVHCEASTYTIGVTVSGLTGTGLILQNNGADDLPASANGGLVFTAPVTHGEDYAVSILAQPSGQSCVLSNASGSAITANVSDVGVTCVPYFEGTTLPSRGQGGLASASFAGGGDSCRFDLDATAFEAAPEETPLGRVLPQGVFRFKLVDCDPGGEVRMSITWPEIPGSYLKYGKGEQASTEDGYYELTSEHQLDINGHIVSFTLKDGALGDDDWSENGEIVDPGGPDAAAPVAGVQPVPTLNQWGLMVLISLAGLLGWHRRRQ